MSKRAPLISMAGTLAMSLATAQPVGEIKGTAWQHTAASLQASVEQGQLVLPAVLTGNGVFVGPVRARPAIQPDVHVPVVVFLHGSSGLGLPAIGEWQRWLATLGVASLAPDSFALPDRVTYTSPIDRDSYEKIHQLRASEIDPALQWVMAQPWADTRRLVLAGASEGAVAVARYRGKGFAARLVYSWSCEDNYFVRSPDNAFEPNQPVLNVMSSVDPYFSPSNSWLDNPHAQGHGARALQGNTQASIVLIPGAPHTLLNLPAARASTEALLRRL